MFGTVRKWGEFVKFSHTIFALPFALAAMMMAAKDNWGWPGWRTLLLILAAMVCARTCAMSFNRIADRKFDALNPRTAGRHLPAGLISLGSAWTLCLLSGLGLVASAFLLNRVCFYLSPVALAVICFYSLTKRFTAYTHFFLGAALALSPAGAWLAVRGEAIGGTEILRLAVMAGMVVFWVAGFDIIYALQDYEFDRRAGLHSLVVAWGPQNALTGAFLAHLLTWGLMVVFGLLSGFRFAYLIGLLLILGCLLLEHWLARRRGLNWINMAFFRLNALVSLIFLVLVAGEVVFRGGFRFEP